MFKRLVVLSLLLSAGALLTPAQTFPVPASRIRRGAGAPSGTECTAAGDVGKVYIRSDGAVGQGQYNCLYEGGTPAWVAVVGSGAAVPSAAGRIACTAKTVSGASSVDFNVESPTSGPCNYIRLTTGASNVTLSLSNGGSDLWVDIIQGATARTVTLDGALTGWCTISSVASSTTTQSILHEGSTYHGAGCDSTDPSVANYCASTTGNDTYTCTLTSALAALTNGVTIRLKADTANTGVATLNVTGLGGSTLGAISILTRAGGALADGDITANQPISLVYNSTGPSWTIQGDGAGASAAAKLNFGFDFRATLGYATDPGFAVFVTDTTSDATMAYPHTFTNALGVSIVAGWDAGASSVASRDRFATGAQFQAGMCYITSGTATFRVDLPATGYYQVISVWGDPGYVVTNNGLITDNGTTRITVTGTATNGSTIQSFTDSASKLNAYGFWENTPVGVNFTSTIFRLVLAPGAGDSRIIHLRIVQQ